MNIETGAEKSKDFKDGHAPTESIKRTTRGEFIWPNFNIMKGPMSFMASSSIPIDPGASLPFLKVCFFLSLLFASFLIHFPISLSSSLLTCTNIVERN